MTENEQLGPAADVQVTVVVPIGKNEPEAGEQVIVPQLPPAVGENVTTAPHWFGSFCLVMFAGQVVDVHGVTVTVNEQLLELFEASITEQLTVVVPAGKQVPEGGLQAGAPTPGQLSLTAGLL